MSESWLGSVGAGEEGLDGSTAKRTEEVITEMAGWALRMTDVMTPKVPGVC